jgi:hypothetical protein
VSEATTHVAGDLSVSGACVTSPHPLVLKLPEDPSLLRNMVYFPKLRVASATMQHANLGSRIELAADMEGRR